MSMFHRSVLSLVLFVVPGCVSYSEEPRPIPAVDRVLATRTADDGTRETFTLDVRGGFGDGKLVVETTSARERAHLGFAVRELERQVAEGRGVKPFSGLLVTQVHRGSGAAAAGLEAGDVLLSLDGKATVYAQQLPQAEEALQPGRRVEAKVLRGQNEIDLAIEVGKQVQREPKATIVPLESVPVPTSRSYCGASLRGIPAEWSQRIWGDARNGIVVTDVVVGSPAWLAGVRPGDLVQAVDGAPTPTLADLVRSIGARGESGDTMQWTVANGDTVHEAAIDLDDYSGEANIWVPLIFRVRDTVDEDVWTVGPFGLLMRNRNEYIAETRTRHVETRNVFSALFGLFRVDTSPGDTDVRLLWIIHFDV